MLKLVTQQSATLDEMLLGRAPRIDNYPLFASHGKFVLYAAIIVVVILITFRFARRRAKAPRRHRQIDPSAGAPLSANMAGAMRTISATQAQRQELRSFGLPWKIAKTFAGTTLFIGLVIMGAVYYVLVDAVERQVNQNAHTIATNLSDTAVTYVLSKDSRNLNKVLAKYAQLPQVAYTFVENRKGEVLGNSFGKFPDELASLLGGSDLRNARRTPATLGGKELYDTRVSLLNGEIGAVHVGVWQSVVNREVKQALIPITGVLLIILIVAVILAIWIASRVSKPILSLAQSADQISRGELDLPVSVTSNDELGELSRSIERLRASLKAAIMRLDRQ